MREHCKPRLSFTRRAVAALVGVWLGVSCLFCCADVTQAAAASTGDADSATHAAASGDPCCHANFRHNDKSEAHGAASEDDARDAVTGSGAREAASSAGARAGRPAAGDGVPCVRCSRQVVNSARRARVLPAPSPAANYKRPHAAPQLVADAARGGASLVLNRSGTHLRLCVLLI